MNTSELSLTMGHVRRSRSAEPDRIIDLDFRRNAFNSDFATCAPSRVNTSCFERPNIILLLGRFDRCWFVDSSRLFQRLAEFHPRDVRDSKVRKTGSLHSDSWSTRVRKKIRLQKIWKKSQKKDLKVHLLNLVPASKYQSNF